MSVDLAQLALSVDANGFVKADRTLTSFNKTASNTEKQADKIAKSTDAMTRSMMAADKILGVITGGFGVLATAMSVDKVIEYADAWTNVSNTLRGVSDTQAELIKTQNKVIALAKDTSSNLEATAGLYSAITRSVSELGVSQERVLGVTKTINNLFLAGGKSAASAAGAITQLNQGLAAGALRGDEFNSVAEGAPRILDAVSKQLGITRGELREFAATGGITAEILIASLESYSEEAQHAADITRRTFSQNAELSKTFALEWVGNSEAVAAFSSTAGQALVVAAQNIDRLVAAGEIFAIVFGVKMVAAISASTAAAVKRLEIASLERAAYAEQAIRDKAAIVVIEQRIAAERAADVARLESLKAVAAQINAERLLENERMKAQISAQGRILTIQRMAALGVEYSNVVNQITAAELRLATTTDVVTASTVRMTMAQRAGAVAMGAMNGALALVGGPAGLAILAAAGIYYFATSATEADKAVENLSPSLDGLKQRFDELGEAGKTIALQGFSKQIAEAQTELDKLNNRLDKQKKSIEAGSISMGQFGMSQITTANDILVTTAEIEKQEKKLAGLKSQFDLINPKVESLSVSFDQLSSSALSNSLDQLGRDLDENLDKYSKSIDAEKERAKAIADTNQQMLREIDLIGNTSKETEILYDLNHKIINATDEESAALIANAKALDAANAAMRDRIELQESMAAIMADIEKSMPDFEAALQEAFAIPGESGGSIVERTFGKAQDINDLAKEVDNFGGAWSRTGSIIADAFGGVADSLNDYVKQMEEIAEKQRAAEVSIPKTAAEEIELEKIKIKLANQHAAATVSGYGEMAGAAASMFKEQSKGRKALNNAEKVFTAIEIALAAKKAAANALTAITSAFSAPFPVNFAAGAAMIAIMSGLGVFGGGGGGGGPSAEDIQKSQGTGTVAGDASEKSESITKSFDAFQNIATEQLYELRGIHSAMTSLSNGIAGLAQSLVVSGSVSGSNANLSGSQAVNLSGPTKEVLNTALFGLFAPLTGGITEKLVSGIFGKTTKKLKDTGLIIGAQDLGDVLAGDLTAFYYNTVETTKKKLFGAYKKVKTKDELTGADSDFIDQVSGIFGYLGDAVTSSLDVLGIDAANAIEDFQISIGKISFKDMNGEEIQKALEAVFSAQGDLLAEFVLPQITEYQKIGEGAFETLTRVAKEQAIFNDALENMGLSLGGLSNIMRVDVAQSIIDLMGGLDEFSSKTSAYFDKFFSEDEKIKMLGDSLNDAFSGLGLGLPKTDAEFRNIVEGLDLTTDAGQQLFASLMELVPGLDQYITAMDKAHQAQLSAAKTLAGQSLDAVKSSIAAEKTLSQSRLDAAKTALSVAQAERDAAAGRYDTAQSALENSVNAEIALIEKARDERLSGLDAELEAAKATQSANQQAVEDAQRALEDALSAEQKMREDAANSQIESYRKIADEAQAYAQSLRSLSDSLRSSIVSMGVDTIESAMARRVAAQASIDQAIVAARGGDFTKAMGLDLSALQSTDGMFATRAERDFNIGVTQNKLAELAALADNQATVEDKTYAAAQKSADNLERHTQQLSSINGAVLSVADATAQLAAAQAKAGGDAEIIASLESQVALAKTTADQQIAALQAQLDALIGSKDAVLSVDDAIKQFLDAKEALAVAESQLETQKAALAVAQSMYDAEIAAYDEIIAQQTELYNSALGIDASVKSVESAIAGLNDALISYAALSLEQQQAVASQSNQQAVNDAQSIANETAMKNEIAALRAENKELQQKMADSLKTIADNSTKSLNRELLV